MDIAKWADLMVKPPPFKMLWECGQPHGREACGAGAHGARTCRGPLGTVRGTTQQYVCQCACAAATHTHGPCGLCLVRCRALWPMGLCLVRPCGLCLVRPRVRPMGPVACVLCSAGHPCCGREGDAACSPHLYTCTCCLGVCMPRSSPRLRKRCCTTVHSKVTSMNKVNSE